MRSAAERRLRDQLVEACGRLHVECRPDYIAEGTWWPLYLPHFGGPNGMVIGGLARGTPKLTGTYVSLVNERLYSDDAVTTLRQALTDWGWFGPEVQCPPWFTGIKHFLQTIGPR
jgi:hypothetical protein